MIVLDLDGPVLDSYGYVVNPRKKRHPLCRCTQPCQPRFKCECKTHRGNRATPWCNGAYDEFLTFCDHCWYKQLPPARRDPESVSTRKRYQK